MSEQITNIQASVEQESKQVSNATDPAVQASSGGLKSLLTTVGAFLALIPAGLYGLLGQNKELTVWAMIVLGAVAIVYIIRQIVMDVLRVWVRASPDKFNTK